MILRATTVVMIVTVGTTRRRERAITRAAKTTMMTAAAIQRLKDVKPGVGARSTLLTSVPLRGKLKAVVIAIAGSVRRRAIEIVATPKEKTLKLAVGLEIERPIEAILKSQIAAILKVATLVTVDIRWKARSL